MNGTHQANLFARLRQRELIGGPVHHRPFVQDLSCEGECSGTIACTASATRESPVFALQYGARYIKFLAAADEEGYVSIINTGIPLPAGLDDDSSPSRPVAQWNAHRNAVFDLQWANSDRWIYTASGDTSVGLWDTSYAYKIASFHGHRGSVKALAVSPYAAEIIATGSCDGSLLVWDSRVRAEAVAAQQAQRDVRHPVLRLREPHARQDAPVSPSPSFHSHANSRNAARMQSRVPPGVTAVSFLDAGAGHVIASGGVDGVVKLWDLRYTVRPTTTVTTAAGEEIMSALSRSIQATNANARLVHLADAAAPTLGRRTHAVTSLALRPNSSQMMVSFTGGHHLLYDALRPETGPARWFGGHLCSSFYVKTAFSPDGTHFMSGSSDADARIWQVDGPDSGGAAPYVLRGHEQEVTAVAWCPTDFCQVATAGDDYTVKIWNVPAGRGQKEEARDPPVGWMPGRRRAAVLAARPHANPPVPLAMPAPQPEREEAGATPLAAAAPAAVPVAPAATSASQLTATAGHSGGTGRLRIANALRQSLAERPRVKRTKQQTLAEALRAAMASGSCGPPRSKRPRSAASNSDDEDMLGSQRSADSGSGTSSAFENTPNNVA